MGSDHVIHHIIQVFENGGQPQESRQTFHCTHQDMSTVLPCHNFVKQKIHRPIMDVGLLRNFLPQFANSAYDVIRSTMHIG